MLQVVSQLFETHTLIAEDGSSKRWHTTVSETDGSPLISSMLVFALALFATRGRMASGIVAAVTAIADGIANLGFNMVGTHFLMDVRTSSAQGPLVLGSVLLVALGLVTLIAEIGAHRRQRDESERLEALRAARVGS